MLMRYFERVLRRLDNKNLVISEGVEGDEDQGIKPWTLFTFSQQKVLNTLNSFYLIMKNCLQAMVQ